ncbi:cytochrome C oxidase subunit I [Kitasatospora misakiensis]|uniref:Cytochrome C oxidase subunit I n=1 Tax=Kitasatospora misakiensis TaxID=67330 RepID=A0ABW0WZB6_9ACTN
MGGRQRPPKARNARPEARRRTGRPGDPRTDGPAVNPGLEIARLEGYLAWEAEVSAAERDARAFADRFPWLAPDDREALEQAYTDDRLRYAEEVVDRAVGRCRALAARYRAECRRICARWAALCLSVAFAAALLAALPAALHG